ncbi:uncharacterized protein [Gossypium hirsutum]|uniref:Gag-Pol polyprotein n=1 Tax=Gossypium hirsutum TaxID=3635 RepID=A0ABM2YR82_GOSHI|nr:uncharacterized protein LOC121205016 [Gossypium hirsutum]
MDLDRAIADDVESNAPAPAEGTAPVESILELREFMVLVERACKGEELVKERRKMAFESNKNRQNTTSRAQITSVASVGSAQPNRPECSQCGRRHFDECQGNERGYFKCRSLEHFIRDYPKMEEREKNQEAKASSASLRGRSQKNPRSGTSSRGTPRDAAMRSEGRAPARTYAIRAREESESPNITTNTFSIHEISVVALIDVGHSKSYKYTREEEEGGHEEKEAGNCSREAN